MLNGETLLKRFRLFRLMYQGCLALLFASIAFYFGPNVMLFNKLTWLSPADFVPTVEQRCMPIVSAMKAYQRDHGRLPETEEEIVPNYVAAIHGFVSVHKGEFVYWSKYNHLISYDFTTGDEGWRVAGPFTKGRIPAPPAPIGPTTSPSTQSSK